MFQVNVLMHTAEVTLKSDKLKAMEKLRKNHHEQDQIEIYGIDSPLQDVVTDNKSQAGSSSMASDGKQVSSA